MMTQKLLGNLQKGLLFILSAPAGTGKTTLVQMLMREFPCVIASISSTTRLPRAGEVDGVDYYFIDKAQFQKKIEQGEFLEYVELYGNFYGTSRIWVENQLSLGKHVILVIDTQGADKVRGKVPVATIFVAPPSLEVLEQRLIKRNTDSSESLQKRLAWAKEEMRRQEKYDYKIINDDLATAYQTLRSILIAEEHRLR